jgi:predicted nucleotidyltransferase component of viral defense system
MKKMNAMSLKAKIRNIAKAKGITAQVVLQHYFFERFLDRLSRSEFHEKFILKGGLLIAVMAGLDARSTMDLDATIRNLPLDEEQIRMVITAICSIPIDDGLVFQITGTNQIRDDAEYGGIRVSLEAIYENINAPLSIDITAGDVITPKPVKRLFTSLFDDTSQFELLTYNSETILAEKVETILRRSISNTRPRDFYDVYFIVKTQSYNDVIFRQAFSATATHRRTIEKIKNVSEILRAIKENPMMKQQWEKYRNEYQYARNITFEDTVNVLIELMKQSNSGF